MKTYRRLISMRNDQELVPAFETPRLIAFFLFWVLIFGVASACLADGIPVTADKKQVSSEYTRILLDDSQTIDVERNRHIVLRPDQKAKLERIGGSPLGHIGVYSSRYNVCTCFDNKIMAIWTQKGVLDFPNSSVITLAREKELSKEFEQGEGKSTTKIRTIIVVFDSKGDMYLKGHYVDSARLKRIIEDLGRQNGRRGGKSKSIIVFDPPPPISEETDRRVVQRYREAKAHCEKVGVETNDWGIEGITDRQ